MLGTGFGRYGSRNINGLKIGPRSAKEDRSEEVGGKSVIKVA